MLQQEFECGVCHKTYLSTIALDQHNMTTHGSRVTMPSKNSRR